MKIIIKNISVIIFCFFISYQNIYAQKIVTIDFDFENKIKFETPAKIDLDNITFPPDSLLTLIEISGDKRTATPFQINNGEPRLLHWIINNNVENGLNHVYELVKVDDKNSYSKMK
ncbi:MAG: hypothetical protein KDC52_20320, partial [Ignavibacteriae bacterium]|nr:hypothetical protein [Ignavibacteriota bacterium]